MDGGPVVSNVVVSLKARFLKETGLNAVILGIKLAVSERWVIQALFFKKINMIQICAAVKDEL